MATGQFQNKFEKLGQQEAKCISAPGHEDHCGGLGLRGLGLGGLGLIGSLPSVRGESELAFFFF